MHHKFKPVFQLLCLDAAFAMFYETCFGPIYLSGLAGELRTGVFYAMLLTALPWIGFSGQILGLFLATQFYSVKKYTLWIAFLGRSLWLVPLVFAIVWGHHGYFSGESFPKLSWLLIVAIVAGSATVLTSSSSAAWMGWMRGLVPIRFQGRFFGTRQRYTMIGIVMANFIGTLCVGWKPGGLFLGYAVFGILGLIAAWTSLYLLKKVPDLPVVQTPKHLGFHSWRDLLLPFKDKKFRAALVLWPVFNGVVQIAGPYFAYYFTKDLQISMNKVSFWTMLANIGAILSAPFWGKKVDQSKDPLKVVLITGLMMAASPLFYLSSSAEVIQWIAPSEHFVNGIAWAGLNIGMISFVFYVAPEKRSEVYFSVYFAIAGVLASLGVLLGGVLVELLSNLGGFRTLWVIGGLIRFVTIIFLVYLVREMSGSQFIRKIKLPEKAVS